MVYSGNSNSCSISGLSVGTTYHFSVIEFNGNANTCNYFVSNYLTDSVNLSGISLLLTASSNISCEGDTIMLIANGAQNYSWTPSLGLITTSGDSVLAAPLTSTTYTVVASTAEGCNDLAEITLVVNPSPEISLGQDTTLCADNFIVLDAGLGLSSYLWSTGDTTHSILADSSGHGIATVSYSVIVTNSNGCTSSEEVIVTFDICSTISTDYNSNGLFVFPNPFSDHIYIISDKKNLNVMMYDMMGNVVFKKKLAGSNPVIQPVLAPGIYFIEVETLGLKQIVKLVKTN